jgi:16S rRNA (cytosine967-C5)-methyltransferase
VLGISAVQGHWLEHFSGDGFGPETLSDTEREALSKLEGQKPPEWAAANMPEGLFEQMQARYVYALPSMLSALDKRAPLTLRINTAQATFTQALARLRGTDIASEPGVFAQSAMHVPADTDLAKHPLMLDGHIEVQDEASQLCAAMVTPPPGGTVVDLCAGAGGKALAIAALNPKARIVACDVSAVRLDALKERAARAQVTNIECVVVPSNFPEDLGPQLLADISGKVHQVLVDAPCGGSGTWRRHPEARWRYNADDIAGFSALQLRLARAGAAMLRPGGRLTFATCSLLPQEGEGVYQTLLEGDDAFTAVDYRTQIHPKMVKKMPETLSNIKECLLLSPHIHGCDGFFVGTLKRAAL